MMKKIAKQFLTVCILTVFVHPNICSPQSYVTLVERPNEKSLKGIFSREVLISDTSFHWYVDAQKVYNPLVSALEALQKHKDSVQLLVFMGTWCEDSQIIIPRLFKLTEAAGFPDQRITLIGVDRNKKTFGNLCEALNITNVPTIIVMKAGKEKGRVVEYGTSGMFDKDLAEILNR